MAAILSLTVRSEEAGCGNCFHGEDCEDYGKTHSAILHVASENLRIFVINYLVLYADVALIDMVSVSSFDGKQDMLSCTHVRSPPLRFQ